MIFIIVILITSCSTQNFNQTPKKTKEKVNKSIILTPRERVLLYYRKLRANTLNKYKYKKIHYSKTKTYIINKPKIEKQVFIKKENLIQLEQELKYACLSNNLYADKTNKKCLKKVEETISLCKENTKYNNQTIRSCSLEILSQ